MEEDVVTARRRAFFSCLRNNACGLSVRPRKVVIDISASNKAGDQLAAQKRIVGWQRTENVGVHDVHKPFAARSAFHLIRLSRTERLKTGSPIAMMPISLLLLLPRRDISAAVQSRWIPERTTSALQDEIGRPPMCRGY